MTKYKKEEYEIVWDNCFPTRNVQKDAFGRTIKFEEHGNTKSSYGWEIDHIWPANPGKENPKGASTYRNTQPLHHKSNDEKGNKLYGVVNSKEFQVFEIGEIKGKKEGIMKVEGITPYPYEWWQ